MFERYSTYAPQALAVLRIVTALLFFEAGVYWGFHVAPMGFWPVTNYGVPAILYCFIFFYLFFAGPGAWAIDNRLNRRTATAS